MTWRAGSVVRRRAQMEQTRVCLKETTVASDDAAGLEDEGASGSGHDRLGRCACVYGDKVSAGAFTKSVASQPECARSSVGGGIQRHLDVLIAPEVTSVGQMHGAFEHVAVSVRAPQVPDAVVA